MTVLPQLERQLQRAAEDRILGLAGGVRVPGRRGTIVPRALVIAFAVALALAGAATAAILITRGAPLAAPHAQDLQSSGVPLPGSARLAGLDAPDPDPGAPPWDIRLSRTAAGETCTAVGQVLGRQFGIVGLDHVFRALPLGGVDACGIPSPDGPILAGARVFLGTSSDTARTVVNGVAGAGARSVTAYGPGGARPLRLGPQGSFITVYRGYVEDVRPRIVVVTRDGRSHTVAFAQSSAFEVADPAGGSPWQVSDEADLQPGAYPDENCAQAGQETGRSDPSQPVAALTPDVCGRLGRQPPFVLMRRFVPQPVTANTPFPYGNAPPRTIVYGAAALDVASLTLAGAGATRAVPIDPHGGAFLAVLDGHVDPRSLTLTARLRSGRTVGYTRSTGLLDFYDNRPVREPPVPAYRNPLPAGQATPPAFAIAIPGTVRRSLRAADPAGGPAWVLQTWQARPNPRAAFATGYRPTRFLCSEAGVIEHGQLVLPQYAAPALPLGLGDGAPTGGCTDPDSLVRFGASMQAQSYVADPYAYAPQPLRTVVAGLLPAGAGDPRLLGAGPPRRLAVDGNGGVLAVLPGRDWDASLRLAVTVAGRTRITSVGGVSPPAGVPTAPEARTPDPDGGAPWGFAGTPATSAYGQIVDGQFAFIQSDGALMRGPIGYGYGGSPHPPGGTPAVSFDTQDAGVAAPVGAASASALTPPEIERRTLPGRTLISGVAQPDVVSVTLATPRDVRTLRPQGADHVLVVVYDGEFFRGTTTATIRLRDGRVLTETLPPGPDELSATAPPPLSLAWLLRISEADAARIRGGRSSLPSARRRALARLEAEIALIRARLAYQHAHPGVLPAD
jgi:hypothetical protein